jgi:hypothetical protein
MENQVDPLSDEAEAAEAALAAEAGEDGAEAADEDESAARGNVEPLFPDEKA